MFIFACPKMNTKGQPFTGSDFVGLFRVLTIKNGRQRKVIPSCGVLRRVACPFFIFLLDCVKWPWKNYFLFIQAWMNEVSHAENADHTGSNISCCRASVAMARQGSHRTTAGGYCNWQAESEDIHPHHDHDNYQHHNFPDFPFFQKMTACKCSGKKLPLHFLTGMFSQVFHFRVDWL